jgi:hypothetical protein
MIIEVSNVEAGVVINMEDLDFRVFSYRVYHCNRNICIVLGLKGLSACILRARSDMYEPMDEEVVDK